MTTEEKEIYLLNAMRELEKLVLQGYPVSYNQPLAFPRLGCFRSGSIPHEVKEAQAENAIALLGAECTRRSAEQISTMSRLGALINYKYNKRNQGEVGLSADGMTTKAKMKRLTSERAERLLKSWIGGNV